MRADDNCLVERGSILASDSKWERACLRAEIIASLVSLKIVTRGVIDNAAKQLNISTRQVYALINRYRQGHGLVTDMLGSNCISGPKVS
ncbi:MAG: transposase [Gammaproteobacteria bacterium]|nr:transposase [Gammaproteobacteria bacterium]